MSELARLRRLQQVVQMASDVELAKVRKIQTEIDRANLQLDALNAPMPSDPDLPAVALALQHMAYNVWADEQRRQIAALQDQLAIAREEAVVAATRAFGRKTALDRWIG